jgi:hypothetical protein
MINFFNENIENFTTRPDLLQYIRDHCVLHSTTTVDTYKNYFIQAGYVKRVKKILNDTRNPYIRGAMFVPDLIPCDISISDVKAKAYPKANLKKLMDYFEQKKNVNEVDDFITEEEMKI